MRIITGLLFLMSLLFVTSSCQRSPQLTVTRIDRWPVPPEAREVVERQEGPQFYLDLHREIRTRDGASGPEYAVGYKSLALEKARAQVRVRSGQSLDWIERGPANVGGRTRGLIVDPRDTTHHTWLAGSVGGGIWKTTDGGQSWRHLTADLPNLATSTLAFSPANPDILYAGTGEGYGNTDQVAGSGVWKSTDGGASWNVLPFTAGNDRFGHVMRMAVAPENPDEIVLAARTVNQQLPDILPEDSVSVIYKSIDGGASWYPTYATFGYPGRTFSPAVQQIVPHPHTFDTLFAAVLHQGILRSTDRGEHWEQIFDVAGLDVRRLELAVSPTHPQYVYCLAEPVNGRPDRLFASRNGGATWQQLEVDLGALFNGQGWYDNTIAVHPFHPLKVWVGGAGPILEVAFDTALNEIIVIDALENNTDFLDPSERYRSRGTEGATTGRKVIRNFNLENFFTAPDTLIEVEVRFGPGLSQLAHRHTGFVSDLQTFADYRAVPFQVWDLTNDRQLMVSWGDLNGDGQWRPVTGDFFGGIFPEDIFIHALPYSETPDSLIAGSTYLEALLFVARLEKKPDIELPADSLPEGTVRIIPAYETVFTGAFEPVTDGYFQYFGLFDSTSSKGVHVDHHNLIFLPVDTATGQFYVLNANDGGVAFSRDGGATFLQTGDTFKEGFSSTGEPIFYPTATGYNTSQFYGVDKMNGGDRYVGGTQDNGSWVSPADPDATTAWVGAPSGDGFEALWHYGDTNLILESSQGNNVFRSNDGGMSWFALDMPGRGPFFTQLAGSQQDPDLVFSISNEGILRSLDFGLTWEVIPLPESLQYSGSLNSVEVSLATPLVVWAANRMNATERPVVSRNGGVTFQSTGGYDRAELGRVTGVATHPSEPGTAFLLFSIANAPKILKTTDYGASWEDISGFVTNTPESSNGFPDVAVYCLLVMPFDTDRLWAGTEVGLFESLDGGQSWQYADNGLPPVSIWQMKIVNDEVVIATHGRGIWTASLPELEGYQPPAPAGLLPQLSLAANGFNGNVAGNYHLRSAYDSTRIEVRVSLHDTLTLESSTLLLAGNPEPVEAAFRLPVTIPSDSIYLAEVNLTAYLDGVPLRVGGQTYVYDVAETPLTEYFNDFDQSGEGFARLGFNIYREAGFTDAALHTLHPYPGFNSELIAVLQHPLIIAEANAVLSFDEIALVEPGEPGAPFGTPGFYDYVTVEGTVDSGATWQTLAGYDANANPTWKVFFLSGRTGAPSLIKNRTIDLGDFYAPGQEVYLRFRLVSDPFSEGWGWMIDNLTYPEAITDVDDPILPPLQVRSYPNPFREQVFLQYHLPEKSGVTVELFSADGKKVQTLIREQQPAGLHTFRVNGAGLAKGLYFCRITAGKQVHTLKWVKG